VEQRSRFAETFQPGTTAVISRVLPVLLVLLLSAGWLAAQVVETPEGRVEFIGLEHWTIPMIRDSMAIRAPGMPLAEAAAVLKELGFVSAAARIVEAPNGARLTIVTVVEPHRRDRIRPRVAGGDSLPDRAEWIAGIELFRDHNQSFQSAIQLRGLVLRGDSAVLEQLLPVFGERLEGMEALWRFLDEHSGESALQLALETLSSDRNGANAAVAAAVLTSFPDHPHAWWALLEAHRDSREYVAATASQAMKGLLTAGERRVDWRPVSAAVRALLDGTNVFVLNDVLGALATTGVSRQLAPVLLTDGGAGLVLARLSASLEHTRSAAHAFLVRLRGRDLGIAPTPWAEWVLTLEPQT
jgi:hypothetical protein